MDSVWNSYELTSQGPVTLVGQVTVYFFVVDNRIGLPPRFFRNHLIVGNLSQKRNTPEPGEIYERLSAVVSASSEFTNDGLGCVKRDLNSPGGEVGTCYEDSSLSFLCYNVLM